MKTGRQFRLSILVFLLSLAAAPSYAEMYVSGALSFNDHSQSNIDDAGGYTLGIGYRPERGWLGGELSYIDAGDANISGLGTLEMSGASASAVFWIQGEEADATGMSGNIKLGVYSMTATVASSTADSIGVSETLYQNFSSSVFHIYSLPLKGGRLHGCRRYEPMDGRR